MVEDVLLAEQVEWIRAHTSAPTGGGYPNGIAGDAIPDGAAILAVADAFDVMTATRIYSPARSRDDALGRVRAPDRRAVSRTSGRGASSSCTPATRSQRLPVILKPCARREGTTAP